MNAISSQLPPPKGDGIDLGKAVSKPQDQLRPQSAREPREPGKADGNERLSGSEVEKLVAMIQDHLSSLNINVSFSTYGDGGERTAVVVSERDTGEVIREFPPEELQQLHMKMEELLGMIFNGQA